MGPSRRFQVQVIMMLPLALAVAMGSGCNHSQLQLEGHLRHFQGHNYKLLTGCALDHLPLTEFYGT